MSSSDDIDEVLDLVDEDNRVIGTVMRGEVQKKLLDLPGSVRAADCFLVNDQGQIWVPRRTAHKRIAPNGLDFSVGEHVKSGETYTQAIIRGFQEELSLDVDPDKLEDLGTINWRARGVVPYIDAVFVYHSNDLPDYNKDDFVSYEWLDPNELRQRLLAGDPAKKNLLPTLEFYIEKKRG